MYPSLHMHMYPYTCTCIPTHVLYMYPYTCTCIPTHVHVSLHMYMYPYTCTCIPTHVHGVPVICLSITDTAHIETEIYQLLSHITENYSEIKLDTNYTNTIM